MDSLKCCSSLIVARCDRCNKQFDTNTLVLNAITKWNKEFLESLLSSYFNCDVQFPLTKEQVDSVAIRFPYDMVSLKSDPDPILEEILRAVTLFRFNKPDYKHRKSCFKKSDECHFSYPRLINEEFGLHINYESDPKIWYTSYGKNKNYSWYAFTMVPRRHVADLFLNTNN